MQNSRLVEAQLESVKAYPLLMTEGSASSMLYRRDGITASICRDAPAQAMANVVTYMKPEALISGLHGVERAYREAGVRAWELWTWTPEEGRSLEASGYEYHGHMTAMSIDLESLPAVGLGKEEYETTHSLRVVGEVNEAVYPDGAGLASALVAPLSGEMVTVYVASWDGEAGAVLCIVDLPKGQGVAPFWLATHERAQGRGLGRRLLVAGLWEARARGHRSAHLQASETGARIYARLGFEPVSSHLFDVYRRGTVGRA